MKSQKIIPSDWGKVFWLVQEGKLTDDRFNYKKFAKQPVWLIKQAVNTVQQSRNLDQLTLARFFQTFINSKQDPKKSKPLKDEAVLLPHPHVWMQSMQERKLHISRYTALSILEHYDWLDSGYKAMIDEHLDEIVDIARN